MVLAEITTLISLLKGIRSTYEWGSEVLSIEWKNECRKYVDYLEEVKQAVTPYENSNKGGLKLLEGELREACSLLDQWMKKTGPHKQLTSAAFLEKVQTSRANIAQNLQLFWFQLLGTEQEHPVKGTMTGCWSPSRWKDLSVFGFFMFNYSKQNVGSCCFFLISLLVREQYS